VILNTFGALVGWTLWRWIDRLLRPSRLWAAGSDRAGPEPVGPAQPGRQPDNAV